MSELKVMKFFEAIPLNKEGFYQPGAFVNGYLKSEADKVIARHKYKRCLAMARLCNRMFSSTFGKERYWQKWNRRWLELAEKFKEEK